MISDLGSHITLMSKAKVKKIALSVLFCLYIAAVAYLCFAKPDQMPQLPKTWFGLPSDKVGHFLMFLPFPLLAFMTFEGKDISLGRKLMLLGVIVAAGAGMAVGTEHIQAQLGYRAAEHTDMLADTAGLIAGTAATLTYILSGKKK